MMSFCECGPTPIEKPTTSDNAQFRVTCSTEEEEEEEEEEDKITCSGNFTMSMTCVPRQKQNEHNKYAVLDWGDDLSS